MKQGSATNPPSISVIVPMHDRRAYIEECIDSIFAQTFQDFEILCIDDGSTDGSAEFCTETYGTDSRFHLVRQAQAGAGAARNRGLALAHGKYAAFLDSDDFIGVDALEKMFRLAEVTQADVVESMGRYLLREGENVLHPLAEDPKQSSEPYGLSQNLAERMPWYQEAPFNVGSRLYRRAFLAREHLQFPELMCHEDSVFLTECFFRARVYVRTPFFYYVQRLSDTSILRGWKTLEDVLRVAEEIPRVVACIGENLGRLSFFKEHPEALRRVQGIQVTAMLRVAQTWMERVRRESAEAV